MMVQAIRQLHVQYSSKCVQVSVEVSRATMPADNRAFPPPGHMVYKMLEEKKGLAMW